MAHTILRRRHHEAQGAVYMRCYSITTVGGVSYLISCDSRIGSCDCSKSARDWSWSECPVDADNEGDVGVC